MYNHFKVLVLSGFAVMFLFACSTGNEPATLTASDYPESDSEQFQLYTTKCGECHAAPLPKIHTAQHWISVVHRMQFRMTSKAIPALNKYEMDTIVSYLQKHASDSQDPNNGQKN